MQIPVAFLVFNRPEATRRVFETIAAQRPQRLLVIADGPRNETERGLCEQTRAIIAEVDWPCEVSTNFSEQNMGCKARVSSGLDWVFSLVETAIILEDDCLPSPSFFPFCEAMLTHWKDDERVMMVAGTNYLNSHAPGDEADYFFVRYFAIWGWATWRRAWRHNDSELREWPRLESQQQLRAYYSQDFMRDHFAAAFNAVRSGALNTWDVQWFGSCLFQNGLSIVPRVNLIHNIGVVGTHGAEVSHNHFRPLFEMKTADLRHPALVTPDLAYETAFFEREFKPAPLGWARRILRRLSLLPMPAPMRRFGSTLIRSFHRRS